MRGIADDLGVEPGTLRHWLDLFGTGRKTAADDTFTTSPLEPRQPAPSASAPRDETAEQRIVRLEARVSELEAEATKTPSR